MFIKDNVDNYIMAGFDLLYCLFIPWHSPFPNELMFGLGAKLLMLHK